jgi:DNA-binding NtrC family response regulator
LKVLIIDDDETICALAGKILCRAGFTVLASESGEAGLELFRRHGDQIDLVLLDWSMPGMTGLETLEGIRAQRKDVPCLISSGHGTEASGVPEELTGRIDFLEKPYRAERILEKVTEILSR